MLICPTKMIKAGLNILALFDLWLNFQHVEKLYSVGHRRFGLFVDLYNRYK